VLSSIFQLQGISRAVNKKSKKFSHSQKERANCGNVTNKTSCGFNLKYYSSLMYVNMVPTDVLTLPTKFLLKKCAPITHQLPTAYSKRDWWVYESMILQPEHINLLAFHHAH
jgi:hypothetical protein